MKLDGFHRIALDTVHYGHERVSQDQVLSVYKGLHVPMDYFEGPNARLKQLTDIFAMPEVTLVRFPCLFMSWSTHTHTHSLSLSPSLSLTHSHA
jgi:hypothetical protein